MSWSCSVPRKEYNEPVSHDDLDFYGQLYKDQDAGVKEQVDAALAALHVLVTSGAIGKEPVYRATLSGHDNPDHAVREGYANPTITVNVMAVFD